MAAKAEPIALRFRAIAAVARFDLTAAASAAADALAAATPADDPDPLLNAFLERRGGPAALAQALAKKTPSKDVAKRALRQMFASGHSDAELADVLSAAAGLAADVPPPTQEEVQKIAAEVVAQGDAVRGEAVFRRADVACLRCHAVARAGGQVGPELSPIGGISPVDYIVNSILNPDLAIKEQFLTRIILTTEGQLFTGIATDRDDTRVILKDAAGKLHTIAVGDIELEKEGKSLMPRGLTKFLTHQEFLDLAKFVSELGKPGPYAIRAIPTVQRWRVLVAPPRELVDDVPNPEQIRVHVLDARPEAWAAAYGRVGGDLPLAELQQQFPQAKTFLLRGELDVVEPGPVQFRIRGPKAVQAWVNADAFEGERDFTVELPQGRQSLTIRVTPDDDASTLTVEVVRPAGSSAQVEIVPGS
jgi:putative heme-binding domain-containing protein